MTKDQIAAKLDHLIAGATAHIKEKALQLASSGAEDIESYGDDFVLPKLLFIAALEYEATQYSNGMSDKEFKKRLRNLRHF